MSRLILGACLLLGPFVGALAACGDSTGNETVEPTLEWSADATEVAAGDPVRFAYRIEGNLLGELRVDFGDGETAVRALGGAQSAEGQIVHAFAEPGVYTVAAEVTDGFWGPVDADVSVTVTGVTEPAPPRARPD